MIFFFFPKINKFSLKLIKDIYQNMVEKNVEALILKQLVEKPMIEDSFEFSKLHAIGHTELVGHLKSLAMDEYVILNQLEKKEWVLTGEGLDYVTNGTPEYRLYHLIPEEGIAKDHLTVKT